MADRQVPCFQCHGTKRYPIGSDTPCIYCGATGWQRDTNGNDGLGQSSFGALALAIERVFPRWLCLAIACLSAGITLIWLRDNQPMMPVWALAIATAAAAIIGYRLPRILTILLDVGIKVGVVIASLYVLYVIVAVLFDGM